MPTHSASRLHSALSLALVRPGELKLHQVRLRDKKTCFLQKASRPQAELFVSAFSNFVSLSLGNAKFVNLTFEAYFKQVSLPKVATFWENRKWWVVKYYLVVQSY